jgi:hypothetical protein
VPSTLLTSIHPAAARRLATGLATLVATLAALALACAAPAARAPSRGLGEGDARAALLRLAGALESRRFDEAHALLSARWRTESSPSRLAADWAGAGPYARDQLARVRSALEAGTAIQCSGAAARLPLGAGKAALLVAEEGGWRVDALE